MDAVWGWGVLFTLALAVPAAMIGLSSEVSWWWIIVSPLPLVVWNVAWLIMANSPRSWRFAISAGVVVLSLFVVAFGVHGLIWGASAQTPPTINGNCNNFGSNNFNCNTVNVGPARQTDGLYQLGRFLGTADRIDVSPDQKQVTLTNLHLAGIGMDLSKDLELQGVFIHCPDLVQYNHPDRNLSLGLGGVFKCDVVGPRQ